MKAVLRIQRTMRLLNSHKRAFNLNPRQTNLGNYQNPHWFLSLPPSTTLQFDSSHPLNKNTLERFMKSKYDLHIIEAQNGSKYAEEISFCHKSQSLSKLFEDINIDHVDNVLQKKIVNTGHSLQQQQPVDEWMLFNYHSHDINNGYDGIGIVICGLATKSNLAYQIGPIVLSKHKENRL